MWAWQLPHLFLVSVFGQADATFLSNPTCIHNPVRLSSAFAIINDRFSYLISHERWFVFTDEIWKWNSHMWNIVPCLFGNTIFIWVNDMWQKARAKKDLYQFLYNLVENFVGSWNCITFLQNKKVAGSLKHSEWTRSCIGGPQRCRKLEGVIKLFFC